MNAITIGWSPLLPWTALGVLAVVSLLVFALGTWRRAAGLFWRTLAATGLLIALANPAVIVEERQPIGDVGLIIVDQSASTRVGDRDQKIREALAQIESQTADLTGLEMRVIPVGSVQTGDTFDGTSDFQRRDGTHLFAALDAAMADIPQRRFAGAIMITDGQIHDVPHQDSGTNAAGPLHALIVGEESLGDRFIEIVQAPSFGIVGQDITLKFRVVDPKSAGAERTTVTLRRDVDDEVARIPVVVGVDAEIDVTLGHGGSNIYSLEVAPGDQEITLTNNNSVVVVNGVRDRLKVLLVSGQPHAGERTWRNLLKSDPAVDLVHFTILRPPNKQDSTPVSELSLIAFPVRELFEIKLNDFDLIIFDNYQRRGVLPQYYLNNIAEYVLQGGALLEAAGPEFAASASLATSPLSRVLPAYPTGGITEIGYHAIITTEGARHPVTAGLTGAPSAPDEDPTWGRWFRLIDSAAQTGTVVMEGVDAKPLLLLDRVGEGRVAQFMSDQIWLWARGFEGGGPHGELMRRLAHWLMKEPELEENVLTAEERAGSLEIVRRSLAPDSSPVTVTFPSGRTEDVGLTTGPDGADHAALEVDEAGIYRLSDGTRVSLVAVGSLNPLEFSDVTATADKVRPVATASGGAVMWIEQDGVPNIRRSTPDRRQFGTGVAGAGNWVGLRANQDYLVSGVSQISLWPAVFLLVFGLLTLLIAWRREGQ
jgi:uncharacterized membrane protein